MHEMVKHILTKIMENNIEISMYVCSKVSIKFNCLIFLRVKLKAFKFIAKA